MLPDDWRKQIEDTAREANNAANEQNRHLYENLSARLDAVGDQIRRYNDTEDRERPKNQRREIGTIRALVAAAIGTGALAIFTAWQAYETHEAFGPIQQSATAALKQATAADKQVTAMQGQLDEMKNQRLTTIAQLRANLRRERPEYLPVDDKENLVLEKGKQFVAWKVHPKWENAGPTNAKDVHAWFDIKAFDAPAGKTVGANDCPDPIPPNPLPEPFVVVPGAGFSQFAKTLSVADASAEQNGKKYILMWGHVDYRDVFPDTPLHYEDWCIAIIPNDMNSSLFSPLNLKQRID